MAETVTDPVCDMDLNPEEVADRVEYQGRTFSFCSSSCKSAFEQDPQRYLVR